MLAETTDSIATALPPIITAVLGAVGGGAWMRRRSNRGNDAERYRYTGKRGSNCKPGHGKVCEKHGEKIEAHGGAIERLGAYQETFEKNQTAIQAQLGDIQEKVTTLVARAKE